MKPNRVSVWFLAAKMCVTAGLLAALTMPFATCDVRGQTYAMSVEVNDIPSILGSVWPVPFLLFQVVALTRRRRFRTVLILECIAAAYFWIQLRFQLAGIALMTFGFATAGPGYDLADACDKGYAALAALELVVSFLRRRPAPLNKFDDDVIPNDSEGSGGAGAA